MTRRLAALCGVTLSLAFLAGCAGLDHEEAPKSEAQPENERALDEPSEDQRVAEPTASPPPADTEVARSLAEIQHELAANNQKLRELGVDLPSDEAAAPGEAEAQGGDGIGSTTKTTTTKQGTGTKGTTSVAPAPGGTPSTQPKKSSKGDRAANKPSRRDKTKGADGLGDKAKDAGGLVDEGERPDPAKAAPLTPSGDARSQDVGAQCQQICNLAEISCDLGVQICDLADHHPGEEDYTSACERANADCEAAQEACNDVCP